MWKWKYEFRKIRGNKKCLLCYLHSKLTIKQKMK